MKSIYNRGKNFVINVTCILFYLLLMDCYDLYTYNFFFFFFVQCARCYLVSYVFKLYLTKIILLLFYSFLLII